MCTRSKTAEKRDARECLLAELRSLERHLTLSSINEAIRLLESEKFQKLTSQQVHAVAEYDSIRIDDESFFEKAFSRGKEVAACLAYAMALGRVVVLEDMARLRLTLLGAPPAPA